ncbi:MAG: DUF2244 domain-containing protein [Pseudomonadota bacterium]
MSNSEGVAPISTFVVEPNEPPPWNQIRLLFVLVAIPSLLVALGFTFMGYWPILPFAGMELMLLAAALYLTARQAGRREVIKLKADVIEVERGRSAPEETWSAQRAWTQVRLVKSRYRLHPSRLVIRAHGKEIEVGSFLIEEERERLATALRDALMARPT